MTKQEFIEKLRAALNGRVSPGLVAENINYYEDYINVEVRKGRAESEVLASLGDPRLIARTIIETNGKTHSGGYRYAEDTESYREYGQYEEYGQTGQYKENGGENRNRVFRIPGWLWVLAVILIIAFVIGLAFSILSFLMPIILPILLVVFLVKLFRDWLN